MAGPDVAADPGGATATPAPPPSAAPNGADHGAASSFTVTDARTAGDAISGLLFGADDDPSPAPEAKGDDTPSGDEPDTGADESRPTGDDDKGQGEQPAAAAIEPPASWTSDEKTAFSQLPPALQQTVVRRESEREAVLTQRSQEAAEVRRAYDGERQAAVAQRQEYLQGLQKMMALAVPEAVQLANVDWVAVQQQSPAEYTRLHALREQLRGRLGAIEQEFQQGQAQLAAAAEQQQQEQLAQVVVREHAALNAKMPDFGDPAKGGALRKDLSNYLLDSGGFTPAEVGNAYDHRLVVLATKAMLYDRQLQAAASAEAKRNNPAPSVRAPGTSQDSDRGPQTRVQRSLNRFGRTNSVRDAGSLISEIL